MNEQMALMGLNSQSGLGARRIRLLCQEHGSAMAAIKKQPCSFGLWEDWIHEEQARMNKMGVEWIPMTDERFPSFWSVMEDGPVGVYVWGDGALLNHTGLAMVGSRHAGVGAKRLAYDWAKKAAQAGVMIISGLARGIDAASHEGCLSVGGKTIAVIGCGLNHVYPKENAALYEHIHRQGLIISEYHMMAPPLAYHFPWRNRLISSLSDAVLVIEAQEKSGALITAQYALKQGKDVWAVPANVDNPVAGGSNALIRDGALVALSIQDVLHSLKGDALKEKQPLTADEIDVNLPYNLRRALNVMGCEARSLDELIATQEFPSSEWPLILLELELKGLISVLPGQTYLRMIRHV